MRFRPDERDLRVVTRRRERGPFGEKAVAGVNRIGAGAARCVDDGADVEVRRDRHRVIEEAAHVARVIPFGVREHGLDLRLATGARDADGDFAAIGDEESFHVIPSVARDLGARAGPHTRPGPSLRSGPTA